MIISKNIILLLLLTTFFQSKAQDSFDEIDFERIPQKKVREYIVQQEVDSIVSFSNIEPSLKTNSKTDDYKVHAKEYFVNDSLKKVWHHYIYTNPADAWDGKRVTVGLVYSNKNNQVVYNNEKVARLNTGQVVYLNLKFMKGVLNLATAIEFITIDTVNYIVEYSYIKGNKTEGKQRMEFFENEKGQTCIVHSSYFKSDSRIRDRFFYPFFHDKFSNEFHRNMRKLYFKQKQTSQAEPSVENSISALKKQHPPICHKHSL
jgi:hypothetical protein